MAYSTTTLSQTLSFCWLVEQFLKLVNIWQSYKQMCDCCMSTIHFALSCLKMQNSPCRFLVYNGQKLLINVAVLINGLIWLYYHQILNRCSECLTQWLTDWRDQCLTDFWSCATFCCCIFFFVAAFCTVVCGIFNIAAVNILLSVN